MTRTLCQYVLLVVFLICSLLFEVSRSDDYPEQLTLSQLNRQHLQHNPWHNELTWGYLLQDFANTFPVDPSYANQLSSSRLNWSIRRGIELIRSHCVIQFPSPGTCQLSSFRDLAYAFAKMNQGWIGAISNSIFDWNTFITLVPFGLISTLELLNNREPLLDVIKPPLKSFFGALYTKRSDFIPDFFRPQAKKLVTSFYRWRKNKAVNKHLDLIFSEIKILSWYAAYCFIATVANVGSDLALSDLGAFFYFINKYTLGPELAYQSWLTWLGSWLYLFNGIELLHITDYTARDYFAVELDMELYQTLFTLHLQQQIPKVMMLDDTSGLLSRDALLQFDSVVTPPVERASSPVVIEQDEQCYSEDIQNLASELTGCGVLTFDSPGTSHFPSHFISLCFQDTGTVEFQQQNQGARLSIPLEEMSHLIQHLLRATHTQRLVYYHSHVAN